MNIKQIITATTIIIFAASMSICNSGCSGTANEDKGIKDTTVANPGNNNTTQPEVNTPSNDQSGVMHLSDQTFEKTISTGVVLVDFWATWCKPCRFQGPIVEEVSKAMTGKARICKLDIDQASIISEQYGIRNIPTLIIFKGGKEVKRFVGITQKADLIAALNMQLK